MSLLQEGNEEILHFSLQGLLPEGHCFVLNTTIGTLSHLVVKENLPSMVMEQQFTTGEICVLMPLLESYPSYCPYEVLLASFHTGRVNEATVARYCALLHEARETEAWDQVMRPVRNVLSRTRLKIRSLHLDISSILETGYIVMVHDVQRSGEAEAIARLR